MREIIPPVVMLLVGFGIGFGFSVSFYADTNEQWRQETLAEMQRKADREEMLWLAELNARITRACVLQLPTEELP